MCHCSEQSHQSFMYLVSWVPLAFCNSALFCNANLSVGLFTAKGKLRVQGHSFLTVPCVLWGVNMFIVALLHMSQPVSQSTTNNEPVIISIIMRTQHEQVAVPDSQPLSWKSDVFTFIGGFLFCNTATYHSGKTNSSWKRSGAAVAPQSDPLVFVNCCFAGMKNAFFFLFFF